MKKKLIVFIILGLLLVVVSSAIALPLNCEYCGSSTAPRTVTNYTEEVYNVACTHGKCAYDEVTVHYTIVTSYCGSCNLPREEVWTQTSKTVQCFGWYPGYPVP